MREASRRAARVLCVDPARRVLLLHWRDPFDERRLWEPPGGGVEPGESDFEAACRELWEETGIPAEAVEPGGVEVARDFPWKGVRFRGPERFFLARLAEQPSVRGGELTSEEEDTYLGHGWFGEDELATLDDHLEPPELAEVLGRLLGPASG